MITRSRTTDGVKLTFSLALDRPVSVVGDFNHWNPAAHPLKPRTNGKRSVVVTLPPGSRHAFRYLAEGGQFFDDPEADGYEDNGYGGTHGVVVLDIPTAAPAVARRAAASKPTAVRAAVVEPPAAAGPSAAPASNAARAKRKEPNAARPAASAARPSTRAARKPKS